MATKKCKKCLVDKNEEDFGLKNKKLNIICKLCINKISREYKKNNKEKVRIANNKYNNENREKVREWNKKHFENNKERVRERARNNYKKYRECPEIVLIQACRNRINKLINRNSKSLKSIEMIGCSIIMLKQWLEFQFVCNMNWENYGSYWHIDHVKPCSLFDLTKNEEQENCFNWKNLRPCVASENIKKKNKLLPYVIVIQELKLMFFNRKNSPTTTISV
jgi:hypothetical protein